MTGDHPARPPVSPTEVGAVLDAQVVEALRRQREIVQELGAPEPGVAGERLQFSRARNWWNEGGPVMAEVRDVSIPVAGRDVAATLYVPEGRSGSALRPAYVYLHGGGYRLGSPRSNDRQLRELAAAWGGIVVSLDYAHLPEEVFPAAVQDTAAAYAWLSAHGADWGIDGGRLACGGSSAGANVAMGAAVAVAMSAGGAGSGCLKAAACVAGVFDDALDTASMAQYGDGAAPNRAGASAMFQAYVTAAQRNDPRFNLLLADPSLFPPLFLAAAECDVYRDSSVRFAGHVARAGAQPGLEVYTGMNHLFFGYSRMVDKARDCVADLAQFLSRELPT